MNETEVKYISYSDSSVAYYKIGSGSRIVFAIHGYGESGSFFSYLADGATEEDITILAIDLPYHHATKWENGLTVTTQDLKNIFDKILKNEQLAADTLFEIWGYSMGGRIALGYFQDFSKQIIRIVLIAPDGIYVNPWYRLATQSLVGNKIFKVTMQHPSWFMNLLKAGYKLRLINKSIYKFAVNFADDPKVRSDLYIRWTAFRKIRISQRKLVHLIQKNQVPITGIYGEFDRIIPYSKAEKFWAKIPSQKNILILNDGHKLLQLKYACYLWNG